MPSAYATVVSASEAQDSAPTRPSDSAFVHGTASASSGNDSEVSDLAKMNKEVKKLKTRNTKLELTNKKLCRQLEN
jgi:hypothetical protein